MDKKKTEKRNKKFTTLLRRYRWWFISFAAIFFVGYFLVYIAFRENGFLPTGTDLEKKDWLMFLGAYLSFSGALFVGMIAIAQNQYFNEKTEERIKRLRVHEIQPVLSIQFEIDSQSGSINFEIEHVGEYPICNVYLFDKYLWHLFMPNEKKKIQVVYDDSTVRFDEGCRFVKVLATEYEKADCGLPKWFNVNYDDADGNQLYQTFELINDSGDLFYSLEGIHDEMHNDKKVIGA